MAAGNQSRAGVVHDAAIGDQRKRFSAEEQGTKEHDWRLRRLDDNRVLGVVAQLPERANVLVERVGAGHYWPTGPVASGRDVLAFGDGFEHGGHRIGVRGAKEGSVG